MQFPDIHAIFFDLDNTLFDHRRAEQTTLRRLMRLLPKLFNGVDEARFLRIYDKHNTALWREMSQGKITADKLKIRRFELTLAEIGSNPRASVDLAALYMETYSKQSFALDGAHEILAYLHPKYKLGVLSNGFPNTQEGKLANLEIGSYFRWKIFSGAVGAMKPAPEIFRAAETAAGARAENLLYIGDSYEYDILGAKNAGWRAIFLNPSRTRVPNTAADAEIAELGELTLLL